MSITTDTLKIDSLLNKAYELRDIYRKYLKNGKMLNTSFLNAYYTKVIYNNASVEGNTLTIVNVSDILKYNVTIHGKSLNEHLEIVNLRDSLDLLNIYLARKLIPNEPLLKMMHKIITNGILEQNISGFYRNIQVYLSTTSYIPPSQNVVPDLVKGLFSWLDYRNRNGFDDILTSIVFSQKLMHIHPFQDGNGRTGRFMLNYMLLRLGFVPIIIPFELRDSYFEALDEANWDETNTSLYEVFILDRIIEAMNVHIDALERG